MTGGRAAVRVGTPTEPEGANPSSVTGEVGTLGGEHDRHGLFGCSGAGGSGLVRIGWRGQEDREVPRALEVDCPICHQRHKVEPTWRQFNELDRDRGVDLVIDAAEFPPDRPGGAPVHDEADED